MDILYIKYVHPFTYIDLIKLFLISLSVFASSIVMYVEGLILGTSKRR